MSSDCNLIQDLVDFFKAEGFIPENGPLPEIDDGSPFMIATRGLLPEDEEDRAATRRILSVLERHVYSEQKTQKAYLKTLWILHEVSRADLQTIAEVLAEATNNYYTKSWVGRQLKAGRLLFEFEEFLADVNDIERIALLGRIGDEVKLKEVLESGRFMGLNIKTCPRGELQAAVVEYNARSTDGSEINWTEERALRKLYKIVGKTIETLGPRFKITTNLGRLLLELHEVLEGERPLDLVEDIMYPV